MAKKCIYCGKTSNLSSEHLVSASVLKVLYGPKIENMHHGKKGGEWKMLKNFEGVIKDVCQDCNTKLSINGFDDAGCTLANEILNSEDGQALKLTFNNKTLGWLLKTHLNLVRDAIPSLPKHIEIDKDILQSIKDGDPVVNNSYIFVCQAIDVPGDVWQYVSSLNAQVGVVNEHDLVISQLRIRQFDTFFIFSSSSNLKDISSKEDVALVSIFMTTLNHDLQSIDIDKSLSEGLVEVKRTIKLEQFLNDIMTTDEYEKLFPNIQS